MHQPSLVACDIRASGEAYSSQGAGREAAIEVDIGNALGTDHFRLRNEPADAGLDHLDCTRRFVEDEVPRVIPEYWERSWVRSFSCGEVRQVDESDCQYGASRPLRGWRPSGPSGCRERFRASRVPLCRAQCRSDQESRVTDARSAAWNTRPCAAGVQLQHAKRSTSSPRRGCYRLRQNRR